MKLHDYLLQNEIHPADFAKAIGIQSTTIYRIISGLSPHLVNAQKIVHATGGNVSYDDLISEVKRKSKKESSK